MHENIKNKKSQFPALSWVMKQLSYENIEKISISHIKQVNETNYHIRISKKIPISRIKPGNETIII